MTLEIAACELAFARHFSNHHNDVLDGQWFHEDTSAKMALF